MNAPVARVWLATSSLVAGTVAASDASSVPWALPLLCLGLVGLGQRQWRSLHLIGVALVVASLGAINASIRNVETAVEILAVEVPRCEMSGVVAEHAGGLGTILKLSRLRCDGSLAPAPLGEVITDGRVGEPGGSFRGTARLLPLGSGGFSSGRRRAGADASIIEERLVFGAPGGLALAAAGRVRRSLEGVTAGLPQRPGALLMGLAIGDTSGFTAVDEERFRRSGLSHLTAVSGSNVAIVLGAIVLLARRLGQLHRIMLAGAALGLYVLVVGPEPSVLRAAAMGAIALLALGWGRRAAPLNALGLAVSAVVVFRPAMVHSVGLQLSVLATAGLVIWSGPLVRSLGWLPRPVAVVTGATVAAQIAVAPLLAGTFGAVSVAGPAANVVAAAAVAPATVLSLAAAVLACANFPLGAAVSRLAEPFARWILWTSDLFGAPAWASVAVGRPVAWIGAALCAAAAVIGLRRA